MEVSLLDKAGKSIYNERKRWNAADRELHFKKEVREPLLWSAEKPNLYRLLIALRVNGKPEQYISQYIGFRKSEIKTCSTADKWQAGLYKRSKPTRTRSI